MSKATIKIIGMTCDHCVKSVKQGLAGLDGVRSVEVSLETGQAQVDYDEGRTDDDALRARVEEIGYRTT